MIVFLACSSPPPPAPIAAVEAVDALLAGEAPSGEAIEAATRAVHERLGATRCGRDALLFGVNAGAEGEIGTGPTAASFARWREDWRAWKARCPRG